MAVLVTGAAGFIGSHLVDRLLEAGEEVVGVDDLSLGSEIHLEQARASKAFELRVADLSDPTEALAVCEGTFSTVYLLAANSDISQGIARPEIDLRRTFGTTYQTLLSTLAPGRRFVLASTSAIYGDFGDQAINESYGPLRPISLYGAAKAASEAYLSALSHLHDCAAVTFRFPNVVGPRLTHGVIFDFVKKLRQDPSRLVVLGDGTQRKPYLYVDDLIDALTMDLPALPGLMEAFHLSGRHQTTVRRIAEIVIEEMGLVDVEVLFSEGRSGWPGDVPEFSYDTSRISAHGWQPKFDSEEAVRLAARHEVARWKP